MKLFFLLIPFLFVFPLSADMESHYAQMEQYVLAPPRFPPIDKLGGNFMKENELAFVKRLGMTHDEFSAVIIQEYNRSRGTASNHIGRVMTMLLPSLSDTNTVPFVRSILSDEGQRAFWGEALYVLGWRGDVQDFSWFRERVAQHRLDRGLRNLFYLACRSRFGWEVVRPDPYPSFAGNPCYDTLKAALESEPELDIRMDIDAMFDNSLKGWRLSEERLSLLQRWLAESEGADIHSVLERRMKDLAKARKDGDSMVYCERPPRGEPTLEESERRRKEAAAARAERELHPYEGPLVVDMDEEK